MKLAFSYRSVLAAVAVSALLVTAGVMLIERSASASGSAKVELTEGTDYELIKQQTPPPKPAAGKAEVMEFFSYGCPHCAAMHPHISEWAKSAPANVNFIRVPVAFNRPQWGTLSRTYYTLQNLGELKRLDDAVFAAIHEEGRPMWTEENVTEWAVSKGIDGAKFKAEFNSKRVSDAVMKAEQLTRNMLIDGVPKIIVGQRYKVLAQNAKNWEEYWGLINRLADKAAKE